MPFGEASSTKVQVSPLSVERSDLFGEFIGYDLHFTSGRRRGAGRTEEDMHRLQEGRAKRIQRPGE